MKKVGLVLTLSIGLSTIAMAAPKQQDYYDENGNQVYGFSRVYDRSGNATFGMNCYYYDEDGNNVNAYGCYVYDGATRFSITM